MKRFSLRMTKDEYEKLKAYCDRLEVSMNDVIRQLIREWKPDGDSLPEREEQQEFHNINFR